MNNYKKKKKIKETKFGRAGSAISGLGSAINGIASMIDAIRNHPEWYEAYPLDGLVSLNFGQREKLGPNLPAFGVADAKHDNVDAAVTLELVLPASTTRNSFLESMQILMNKLRAASGSNITYTINDLALYVLNARQIVALYSVIRRAILSARLTDPYDSDAPYKYMMIGLNSTTVPISNHVRNLASDMTRLNRLSSIIEALIPMKMSLMARTAWLFSNIFADGTTAKFATKQFVLYHDQKWQENTTSGAIENFDIYVTANRTITDLLDRVEDQLLYFTNQVQNSRIAGDLMKAYGAYFMKLNPVTENSVARPIYDEAALQQIQNAKVVPMIGTYPKITIGSNSIAIVSAAGITPVNEAFGCTARDTTSMVTTYKDSVTPGEIISMTRLTARAHISASTTKAYVDVCGTEIVTDYLYVYDGDSSGLTMYSGVYGVYEKTATAHYVRDPAVAEFWSMDDWGPALVLSFYRPNETEATMTSYTGVTRAFTMFDMSNWTVVSSDDLIAYNQIAVLSLTATPASVKEQSSFKFVR